MITEPAGLALAFVAGMAFGAGYLALLWGSVRRLARSRRPVAMLAGGAAVRIAGLMGLFYLVMDGRWERLLACLAGFVAVRAVVTRRARPAQGD